MTNENVSYRSRIGFALFLFALLRGILVSFRGLSLPASHSSNGMSLSIYSRLSCARKPNWRAGLWRSTNSAHSTDKQQFASLPKTQKHSSIINAFSIIMLDEPCAASLSLLSSILHGLFRSKKVFFFSSLQCSESKVCRGMIYKHQRFYDPFPHYTEWPEKKHTQAFPSPLLICMWMLMGLEIEMSALGI